MTLHPSVSGAALNTARIPAFTAELGGYMTVDHAMVRAAVSGIRNVMRWAGMLNDAPEPITGITVLSPDYPIRRTQHPFAPHSGILHYYVEAGQTITAGQTNARLTDIYCRPLGGGDGGSPAQTHRPIARASLLPGWFRNSRRLRFAVT